MQSQLEIGWNLLPRGFLSIRWVQFHCSLSPNKVSEEAQIKLGSLIITSMFDLFLKLWTTRNATIHGDDQHTRDVIIRDKLATRIDAFWYRRMDIVQEDRNYLFLPSPEVLKQRPIRAQEHWLEFAEIFFPLAIAWKELQDQGQTLMTSYFEVLKLRE